MMITFMLTFMLGTIGIKETISCLHKKHSLFVCTAYPYAKS